VVGAVLPVLATGSVALAAGDANMAACSNEASAGFRSYLTDCRAYEMVSPPFKDGFEIQEVHAVSGDGSRVIGESIGAFGGVESDHIGAMYVLSRSGSGWATSAISPPASLFPAEDPNVFTASTDLGRTLWGMRTPSQSIYAKDLYVREPGGSFAKIGAMVPPSAAAGPPAGGYQLFIGIYDYAGASSDLSHVLFRVEQVKGSVLWPGDTTAEEGTGKRGGVSLYEYVGIGNRQPRLVGVSDGRAVVGGEMLAAGKLISDCSTSLGSERGRDTYNAVSADGEVVFFTARGHSNKECKNTSAPEVSELYARLGGIETVAVSEPSPSQCEACSSTSAKMPAEFQGASQDGSKAFFLTEQELLPGDTTSNLYEYDFDNTQGNKIVRVSVGSPTPEVRGVARVSADGSHVYFVADGVLTGESKEHRAPVEGKPNLYVFERDAAHPGVRVAFIATLTEADEHDWGVEDRRPVQATPDGRFLAFQSRADLMPGDTSSEPQVFEYDALNEELARVSTGQTGYADGMANADANPSTIAVPLYGTEGFRPTEADHHLALSDDGSKVVFTSTGALTAGAQTAAAVGASSVYEYRSAGPLSNGNVYLISDGKDVTPLTGARGAVAFGLDASGGDVLFKTADPLLAQDVDTQFDLYDARAGGGFPVPVGSAGCEGEACQGTPSGQPSFGVPGSVSVPGTSNVSQQPPPPGTVAKPKRRSLTRAEGLAKALRACKREHGKQRASCEKHARKRYRVKTAVNARSKR
jgi:hypothetical protein